ncbi:hypothetical protein T11_11448 [Trichinella zimbabwensis]|uniref:Uncharacterized protein n=1 Tax=Trichinella zimbabwensis TaxID=268475 RepID=A0A0V1HNK0_9BILA|nr:hypothetical protein T11_11448 [Trichinella zimbabwensis]
MLIISRYPSGSKIVEARLRRVLLVSCASASTSGCRNESRSGFGSHKTPSVFQSRPASFRSLPNGSVLSYPTMPVQLLTNPVRLNPPLANRLFDSSTKFFASSMLSQLRTRSSTYMFDVINLAVLSPAC